MTPEHHTIKKITFGVVMYMKMSPLDGETPVDYFKSKIMVGHHTKL